MPSVPGTAWIPADEIAWTGDPPALPAAAVTEPPASVVDLAVARPPASTPVLPHAADALAPTVEQVDEALRTVGPLTGLPSCGAAWLVGSDERRVFVELRFDHEVAQSDPRFLVIGTGNCRSGALDRPWGLGVLDRVVGPVFRAVSGRSSFEEMLDLVRREVADIDCGGPSVHVAIGLLPDARPST